MPILRSQPLPAALGGVSIFSPARTRTSATDEAAAGPLGGASVAGMISVKGRPHAIVRTAEGAIKRLAIGERFAGLRLLRLDAENAWFDDHGRAVAVRFGAAPLAMTREDSTQEEQQ